MNVFAGDLDIVQNKENNTADLKVDFQINAVVDLCKKLQI